MSAVAPNGRLAGSASPNAVRWESSTPRALATVRLPETGKAINSTGVVLGVSDLVHVSTFARWDAQGRGSTPAHDVHGYVSVAGVTEAGIGIGSISTSPRGSRGVLPQAVRVTSTAVEALPVPAGTAATADAVSPNGAWIVGRSGPAGTEPSTAVRFGSSRPAAIPGATAGFVPRDVDDSGRIVGSRNGRAVGRLNGRLYDRTALSTGLPRGWVLTDAVGVNRRGDIAANALDPATGRSVAVALTRTN